MELVRQEFHRFNQGRDIKGGVGDGVCAGLSMMFAKSMKEEEMQKADAQFVYKEICTALDSLKKDASFVKFSQKMAEAADIDPKDVIGEIHTHSYNRVGCMIAISTHNWVPILGYVSYLW